MLRTYTRRAPRLPYLDHSARQVHTPPKLPRGSQLAWGLGAGTAVVGVAGMTIYADSNTSPPGSTTLGSLARSYLVYSLCSVPPLVNHSPSILNTCANIPGLRELSEAVVRRTFFAQFVGGDSLPDTLPLITSLRQQNTGTLLVYSVEADGDAKGSQWEKNVQEILASVNFAGDFEDTQSGGGKTWVAVKLTALLPSPDSLKRLSTFLLASRPKSNVPYPGTPDSTDVAFFNQGPTRSPPIGLSHEDITALHGLYQGLRQICAQAKARGVRITVDAEHSWYQPGIDAFVTALSREFNQPSTAEESKIRNGQPVVYGTYQAYLRRTSLHLARAMDDAKKHGYSLGVKLVRGAYHGQEIAHHEKRMATAESGEEVEPNPAVWLYKHETDHCFDEAAELLIKHGAASLASRNSRQPKLGLLFGTHNEQSCRHVLDCMIASGLARKNQDGLAEVKSGVEDMVCFGQLYGMRDELTNWIANVFKSESPMAFKYLPYGALAEVMPYLSRREAEMEPAISLTELLRSYFVYSMCSVPILVNWSPSILEACASVPGIREISQAFIRRTFFAQFVGGDTCDDTLPLIALLRKQNKGTLLAYSVEVDETRGGKADQWKKNVEEMVASVDFAGSFEDTQKGSRKTWVAIKLSALVPSADSLKRMSKFLLESRPKDDDVPFPGTPGSFDMVVFRGAKDPLIEGGLTEEDITSLRTLYEDLRTVCNRAKERGVRLIFDAEHTWYQPGIDAFVLALSREFNRPSNSDRFNEQPLVYATYQAYLKRTPTHLARSIQDAQDFGYLLGVKLVRGAYYDKETVEHPESESPNYPVWTEKPQTDACYNACARLLINELAKYYGQSSSQSISKGWLASPHTGIGLLFGTHNTLSCMHIMESLVDTGLASRTADGRVIIKNGVEERLCFGQLYGMRDDLTEWMVQTVQANSPMVLKYVPYGALADVMPYLARRFTCPEDGPVLVQGNEWAHWTDNDGQFNAELLPDPEYYSPEDLAVMPRAQHKLFSSRNPAIVRRHFNIMAMHGIDGAFVTRRGSEIAAAYQPGGSGVGLMKLRSEGINTVFRAAEAEGRVVSMMYDLHGLPSHQIETWVVGDWDFMLHSKHVIESPAYVREHGQPVVALWSVGFKHAGQDPEMIMRLINRIREMTGGAYIMLGVPITWQKQDQNWQAVYSVADAIAPMCIGTLLDEEGVNNYSRGVQHPGVQALKSAQHKTDYVGVVWPGNEGELMMNTGASTDPAHRQDGAFFWRQVYNAHKDGVRFMYAEMFDGFEEGTAILPSLGAQSDNTPSDWYLRICSYASEALKGEKRLYEEFPRKEIMEYWSTRPHYEEHQEQAVAGGSTSAPAASMLSAPAPAPARSQTRSMTTDIADAPPPYSLEADASPAPASGPLTTEPESIPSGPANPAPAPLAPVSFQNSNFFTTERPPVSRVDSAHSVGSHGSYHGQQHRPDPIAVPGGPPIAVAIQTPHTGHGLAQPPTGFLGGATSPLPMQGRPPQHPSAATRPPATSPRPPSRPGRPPSSSGSHPSPPPGTFPSPGGGGVHHITTQMGALGMGPNRPAPEHVFAGVGQSRPQMTGAPSSPFEGVNIPVRYGTHDSSPGLFGSHSSIPPTPSSGGIPGSPFYPAPLQGGGPHTSPGPTHQHSLGPAHHSPGPAHQNTLPSSPHPMNPPSGPHHQNTIGPGQHAPSPHHQNSIGPSPHHQNSLGLNTHHSNIHGSGLAQPPQPGFQAHQPVTVLEDSTLRVKVPAGNTLGARLLIHTSDQVLLNPIYHMVIHKLLLREVFRQPQEVTHKQGITPWEEVDSIHLKRPGIQDNHTDRSRNNSRKVKQHTYNRWAKLSIHSTIGKFAGEDKKKKLEQGIGNAFTGNPRIADKPPLDSTMIAHSGFMSYLSQSFVPGKFSRLCILGVDIVGIPVVLVVGLPQTKALAVAGWFGLRLALTGLCYLEYRWDLATRRKVKTGEEKQAIQLPVAECELPVTTPESRDTVATLPEHLEPPKPIIRDAKAPIESGLESDRVEFPRMDPGLPADPETENEAENDAENGGRSIRKISMSSVDSDGTMWSECLTPAQTCVELPVELNEEPMEVETPRPGEERWFSAAQDEVLAKPEPEPERKNPPLRRKRSKYGSCPLVLRKSTASLYVSPVTAKTEAN
ncbi:unnamed protein product [Rhizoctonia solani]|uniref:proline dehydrogenase n=1 Tax=Rhizoctonia solani TaxID=456999 RepID=A0A8H3CXV3_9AGAM|nr:unnamed protein product [Rhizoctonia solani]